MNKLLIPLFLLFYSFPTSAQNCLNKVYSNILYYNPKQIINGQRWMPEKRYSGSPLLVTNYWPKADILFDGKVYKDVQMNFDVFKNEMIMFSPEKGNERYIILNKEKLSEFTFTDSLNQEKHLYVYLELIPNKGKSLYEKIQSGNIQFFIQPIKDFKPTTSETNAGTLTNSYKYFLDMGSGLKSFGSKHQLIKLLETHRTELNKYIKKENLTINDKHPRDTVLAIRYLGSLK